MGVEGGKNQSILDQNLLQPAADTSLPSGYGPTVSGSSTGLGSLGKSSLPSYSNSSSSPNIMGTLNGLAGLANSGLSIYGALNQHRPVGNILNGGMGNGLNSPGGASIGGGAEKLGGGAPSPQNVQIPQMAQSGLPNNRHFQVLLNLLGVKQG